MDQFIKVAGAVAIFASCRGLTKTLKMGVKKSLFYLPFLVSENLGPVIHMWFYLFSSFLKCRSFTVNDFVFIHRKTLSMAKVYIEYNLNAQTHTINSTVWSDLSQSKPKVYRDTIFIKSELWFIGI